MLTNKSLKNNSSSVIAYSKIPKHSHKIKTNQDPTGTRSGDDTIDDGSTATLGSKLLVNSSHAMTEKDLISNATPSGELGKSMDYDDREL
jgi:hypothetical protein